MRQRSAQGAQHPASGEAARAWPFGEPVTFAGSMGVFHAGRAPVAVLMLGAIGYEEFCLRATWRSLAQALADKGIACLRFDYPGQGDAHEAADPQGLDDWFGTVRAAADLLRRASGCKRLVLLGQGLGGALALRLAEELAPVTATVLLAPVGNGKRYLRELSAWARIVSDRIGMGTDPDDHTRCAVAGLRIAPGYLPAIAALGTTALQKAPSGQVLLLSRPGHGGDAALAETLTGLGAAVTQRDYEGYETLTTDSTTARPPKATIAGIVDWIAKRAQAAGSAPDNVRTPQPLAPAEGLLGDGFVERPIRFGPEGRLFGVLCEPLGPAAREPIIFVNAGRDYHIGWARVSVNQARAFAARGIASLRFDASSVGDSGVAADGPEEILYSQAQIDDVRLAIDAMQAHGFDAPVLIGRCSGAYAAFHAAVVDERIRRLVIVNNERFVWDPDESVEDAIRYAHRSTGDLGATLARKDGLGRLLTGKLRVGPAGRYLIYRYRKRLSVKLSPMLGRLTKHGRLHHQCHHHFATLAARKVELSLLYADGDVGIAEFQTYFGEAGKGLAAYPNASLTMLADADHNFTHLAAGRRLLDALIRIVAP
ncbi:alpha/beta fold hydrolase [Bosea sp. Root483D1]|uniref:alpha/beta fold hydrolase n=1 Tax=Bosea sp. Root483D1 TaxID=1736544 RepID=UPI000A56BCCE|nr:alpha/beta fold hydrolase [Bosea sp. Root483D1]